MVFALDEFQQRYLEDLETKEWLERVIRKAGEEQFPLLKANIKGKDLNPILDDVVNIPEDKKRLLPSIYPKIWKYSVKR